MGHVRGGTREQVYRPGVSQAVYNGKDREEVRREPAGRCAGRWRRPSETEGNEPDIPDTYAGNFKLLDTLRMAQNAPARIEGRVIGLECPPNARIATVNVVTVVVAGFRPYPESPPCSKGLDQGAALGRLRGDDGGGAGADRGAAVALARHGHRSGGP